jgi:hypothetical protein
MNKPRSILPDTLPTDRQEMLDVMKFAKDNNAVDEFISKLPPNAQVDKVKQVFDNMPISQPKEDNLLPPMKQAEPRQTASGIAYSNGSQTLGGAAVGGTESEFNQRDYNNDGKHDYKDNLIGALIGAVGVSAARKIMPSAFKDANVDKNTAGMFVGAKPNEAGAFSDVATKKTMREIDDSSAMIKPFQNGKISHRLNEVIDHPELFNKYPELKNIFVSKGNSNYFDGNNHIKIKDMQGIESSARKDYIKLESEIYKQAEELDKKGLLTPEKELEFEKLLSNQSEKIKSEESNLGKGVNKSTLLHEVQHVIQNKEGWARGGNPENFVKPKEFGSPAENINKIQEMWDARQIHKMYGDKWESEFKSIFGRELKDYEKSSIFLKEEDLSRIYKEWKYAENPHQAYQNLHGEQQARATQQRMNYTPEQRASEDWTQTLAKNEGKYNEPIIKYDGNVSMMSPVKSKEQKEMRGIYNVTFNGKNSTIVRKADTDAMLMYNNGNNKYGAVHIGKHLENGSMGEISKEELLNLGEVIRDGRLYNSHGKNVYELDKNGIKYKVVTTGKEKDKVITYYSNRNSRGEGYATESGVSSITNDLANNKSIANNIPKSQDIKINSSPTLSGGVIGGITGANNDLNGDGKTNYKDILIGVGIGAGGIKGALLLKNTKIATKAKDIVKNLADTETADKIIGHKIYQKTDYMALREAMISSKNKQAENFAMLHEQLKLLDDTTRTKMYNYMNGDKRIQLDTNIKQLADNYTNEINKMGKELVDLGVLEQAQFDKFKDRYLHRRYEKDFSQKFNSLFSKGKTIQGVHPRGNEWNGTKTEYEQLLNDGKIGDFFNGKIEATKMQNGQYKFRQDWTEEQRTRWGEVKDIAFSLPETLMRTREMVDHATMLKNIVDKTGYISDDALDGYEQLVGKRFGALNGKYVPTDMKLDITEFSNALFGEEGKLLGSKAMEAFKALSTFWKKSHTVYNPIAHLNNLTSNVTMQFGAGINPHKAVTNATKGAMASQKVNQFRELTAKKLIGLSQEEQTTLRALWQDEDLKLWNKAQEAGLFGRSNLNDILNKYVNPNNIPTSTSKFKNGVQKVDDTLSSWYQGEDNIMRFSMIKSLIEDGMSFDAAFKKVNETIPDYTKPMSKWARFGRDSMLTPFISWTYYATPIILKQMKDKPERIAAIYGALYGINQMFSIDPFNEKDIPQQNFSMKRIPIYKDGNEVTTIKVDRWIPHGDILSPLDFIKNLTSGGAWAGGQDVLRNRNSYFGGKITNNEGALKAYDLTKYAVQQITPDVIDNIYNLAESKILSKEKRTKNPVIQPRTTAQELIKMFGINAMTYNKANQAKEVEKQKLNKLKKNKED